MKTMREAYFENFAKEQTPAGNRRGFRTKYRYIGKWLDWDLSGQQRRREKLLLAAVEGLSIAAYLAASLQRASFNTQRLSSGIFVLALIPWIAEIWGVAKLIMTGKQMMLPDFDEIRNCITIGSTVRMVLIAAGVIAGLAALIPAGTAGGLSIAAACGHLISGAASFIIFSIHETVFLQMQRR